jgi:hypothetical protein
MMPMITRRNGLSSTTMSTSSTLWAHLLRKDRTNEPIPAISVPIAPADKTGTSVRLLLHDTQATLEKFSQRIDKLVKGVDEVHSKAQEKEQEWADEVERSTKSIVADAGQFILSLSQVIRARLLYFLEQTTAIISSCAYIHLGTDLSFTKQSKGLQPAYKNQSDNLLKLVNSRNCARYSWTT